MGPMGERRMRIVGGADHPVDQVARQDEFEAAHPEVTIRSPRETGTGSWEASWATDDDTKLIVSTDLRWLLDDLDWHFPH